MNGNEREIGKWKYALPVLMVLLSYLMVSNIEYPSFKGINWRTRRSMGWVIGSIFVIAFTARNWQWMPMVLFVAYLAYGLVRPWISRRWRHELEDEEVEEVPVDETAPSTTSAKKPGTGTQDPAASI
jgi:CDP-diacylglycerol--serine O-phosphatidyltransferase